MKPSCFFGAEGPISLENLAFVICHRNPVSQAEVERMFSDEAVVLTERLGISQEVLASVVGLSESTISRMRDGSFAIERGNGKAFELAQLLIQLYNLLDLIVVGDEAAARAWLTADNSTLQGRPIELIQRVQGLANVNSYLRARRSLC